jgi:hypothetical protein
MRDVPACRLQLVGPYPAQLALASVGLLLTSGLLRVYFRRKQSETGTQGMWSW